MTKTATAPTVELQNGHAMPLLRLGTWPMRYSEAIRAVREAIDGGYRLIDTAEAYENEEAVGAGLRESSIPR